MTSGTEKKYVKQYIMGCAENGSCSTSYDNSLLRAFLYSQMSILRCCWSAAKAS